jgi:predicted transglutaminase-like cysteine proteinase
MIARVTHSETTRSSWIRKLLSLQYGNPSETKCCSIRPTFTLALSLATPCPEVSTLIKIVDEARQNQGKALLGHLNRSINLLIKAAPGNWTGPLEAITMRNGDCKSCSIAKYAAVRAAGLSPDDVGLIIVHNTRHNWDHMVVAVDQDKEWLILDNLTNLLLKDSEEGDYEPTAVLDYTGVRRYLSAFWMD